MSATGMSAPAIFPALPDLGGPAQPLLQVLGLRKHFPLRRAWPWQAARRVHAVDGVSFAIRKGETLAVVGESGCGKSTLARLIARLLVADAGKLVFDGEGVAEYGGLSLKHYRRQLQMVFQDSFASLNPRFTALETVAYGPQVHGLARRDAVDRAAALLQQVGLDPVRHGGRLPPALSGGQRQRINIARALAFQPRLLVLDEAVAALDKSVQAQVLNLLQELKAQQQLTYLFISHDLQVVRYLADRVLVMYLGQVVEIAPVETLYRQAAHPYTQALLAAMPALAASGGMSGSVPVLAGDPPNPVEPPPGCRFAGRCPRVQSRCRSEAPPLLALAEAAEHQVACHLAGGTTA